MRLEIALAAALILAGCAQQPSPVLQASQLIGDLSAKFSPS